jgi:hypothetical protein
MKLYLAFFLLLLMNSIANAGGEVGNGGEVVACRDSKGALKSAELLDSFEGRVLHEMSVDLGASPLSVDQKLQIYFQRIGAKNPTRADLYRKWAGTFFSGVTWVTESLPATPDVDPIIFPAGCGIEQIAIQKNNRGDSSYDSGPIVRINKPLWQALSADQQTVLIMHEIIYHEALSDETKSAEPIRYLNQLYFSNKISSLSYDELAKTLLKTDLYEFDFQGIRVQVYDFYPEHLVAAADQDYKFGDSVLHLFKDGVIQFLRYPLRLYNVQVQGDNAVTTKIGVLHLTREIGFRNESTPTLATQGYLAVDSVISSGTGWTVHCAKSAEVFVSTHLDYCSIPVVGGALVGPNMKLTVLNSAELEFDSTGSLRFPNPEKTKLKLGGEVRVGNNLFKFSDLFSSGPGSLQGLLETPTLISSEGNTFLIDGRVEMSVSNDQSFRLGYFEPKNDLIYKTHGKTFFIAAHYPCPSTFKPLNGVLVDEYGHLHSFVLAKDMENQNIGGDIVTVRKGERALLERWGDSTEGSVHFVEAACF